VTLDQWLVVAGLGLTIVGAVLGATWWLATRLARQDVQIEWLARTVGKVADRTGSNPPPRPKFESLPDPFEDILREDQKRNG
jgi:hypothetical protein